MNKSNDHSRTNDDPQARFAELVVIRDAESALAERLQQTRAELKTLYAKTNAMSVSAMREQKATAFTRLRERYAHLQKHQTEQDKAMLGLSEEIARLRKEISRLRTQRVA